MFLFCWSRFYQRSYFQRSMLFQAEMYLQERISLSNKIEEINKKCSLEMSSNEKYELLLKLQKVDKVMEKINEKWKRKRLINITYLFKRVLSEYDETRADKILLHLSEKILKFYDEWYDNFLSTQ